MNATIYDIAREAGVSIATVSRVFNNNDRVTEKTRTKVLSIAKELGYHPRAQAQSLARQSTKIITAIVPIISNYFFMEVLAGMQDELANHDYDLHISNVKTTEDIYNQVEGIVKRGMSEGIIVISIHFPDDKWNELKPYDIPITLIDEYYSDFDSVSVDSTEGAYNATRFLIQQGYGKIALISAAFDSEPVKERLIGYRRALEDEGQMVDEALIVTGRDNDRDGFTEKNGYEAMKTILNMEEPPDACFCASDIQALGALKAMQDMDRSIPIIGFDDLSFSKYLGLTTMRQPMYDMGKLAIDKLIQRLKNNTKELSHTVFSPELIVRSTTPAASIAGKATSSGVNKKILT